MRRRGLDPGACAVKQGPEYPLLWDGSFSLGLSHALRTVELHDAIVSDLLVRGSPLALNDRLHDDDCEGGLILRRGSRKTSLQRYSVASPKLGTAWCCPGSRRSGRGYESARTRTCV